MMSWGGVRTEAAQARPSVGRERAGGPTQPEDWLPDAAEGGRVVVVDDEPDVCETFADYLGMHGFTVSVAYSGAELRRRLAEGPVDLVLLDRIMPGEDGMTLARAVRDRTDAGVIMVTAAAETPDRIAGLDVGADDYVGKPVELRELVARAKSVLRRIRMSRAAADASPKGPSRVRMGRFVLDLERRRCLDADGGPLALTSMEFDLLEAFARHPNRVLSRDELLDLAHHRGWEPFDRSVDIRVARIRRKIELDPANPSVIRTVRGAGYILVTEPVA